MSDEMKDAQELLKAVMEKIGPMVSEELASRLIWCSEEYDLNLDELLDAAAQSITQAALFQNVEDGNLDVVSYSPEGWMFRQSEQGKERVEELLSGTPEGKALVDAARSKREADDDILAANTLHDKEQP